MFFVIDLFLTVVSYQCLQNDWIFINHGLFFWGKIFSTFLPVPVLKISKNSLNIADLKKCYF